MESRLVQLLFVPLFLATMLVAPPNARAEGVLKSVGAPVEISSPSCIMLVPF